MMPMIIMNWGGFSKIRITADGGTIFLLKKESYQRGSLWRMDQSGGAIMKLFEYKDIIRDGGTGAGLKDFDISDDGNVIAFILIGYHDLESNFHYKYEIFVRVGSAYDQLTDDEENIMKDNIGISGNGNKIIFTSSSPENYWYSINRNGSNKTIIDNKHFDALKPEMDYEGKTLFYRDDGTNGGRTANTDGIWNLDMFSKIYNNTIDVYSGLSISDDASRISFIHRQGYDYYALYYGYINDTSVITDSPEIINIEFSPYFMSTDPEAVTVMENEIIDPQGITDIENTMVEILINGFRQPNGSDDVPVRFWDTPNDDGTPPDIAAGDGLFCTEGVQGPAIDEFSSITVRLGVSDKSKNITVADTVLFISSDPVRIENYTLSIDFSLIQNYPNPFNPTTQIDYSLNNPVNVSLKVFNILGEEVAELVNEKQTSGSYSVFFDASELSSGIYFYTLKAANFVETKKMILIK